jgi:hypothetical protein
MNIETAHTARNTETMVAVRDAVRRKRTISQNQMMRSSRKSGVR